MKTQFFNQMDQNRFCIRFFLSPAAWSPGGIALVPTTESWSRCSELEREPHRRLPLSCRAAPCPTVRQHSGQRHISLLLILNPNQPQTFVNASPALQLHRGPRSEGPALGLMLCLRRFETLQKFWTQDPALGPKPYLVGPTSSMPQWVYVCSQVLRNAGFQGSDQWVYPQRVPLRKDCAR